MNKFDKLDMIKRAREIKIKLDNIAFIMDMNLNTCMSLYKRAQEVEDLGEKPIIKKTNSKQRSL